MIEKFFTFGVILAQLMATLFLKNIQYGRLVVPKCGKEGIVADLLTIKNQFFTKEIN